MLTSFKRLSGSDVKATDGDLGNAIRFFVHPDDWSLPLVMVGGGRATTGELMVPTRLVAEVKEEGLELVLDVLRRALVSSRSEVSGVDHGVFDALRAMGASVTARGASLGKVVDLMVDTERPWRVRYLVVDINALEPGREMLFSTEWISDMDVEGKRIDLDVDRDEVHGCPQCDLRKGVEREYERRLHEHYDKPVHLGRFG